MPEAWWQQEVTRRVQEIAQQSGWGRVEIIVEGTQVQFVRWTQSQKRPHPGFASGSDLES